MMLMINGAAADPADADLARLQRAVLISLFTWRRAQPGDVSAGESQQGWWGDRFARVAGDRIGSRLWLLQREKITMQTLLRAKEYAREALAWLVEDSLAERVDVAVERMGLDGVAMRIAIYRGGDVIAAQIDDLWEQLRVSDAQL
ncbi:phage GP46 family protein [Chitinibacteraceae bacterium HSL-7]